MTHDHDFKVLRVSFCVYVLKRFSVSLEMTQYRNADHDLWKLRNIFPRSWHQRCEFIVVRASSQFHTYTRTRVHLQSDVCASVVSYSRSAWQIQRSFSWRYKTNLACTEYVCYLRSISSCLLVLHMNSSPFNGSTLKVGYGILSQHR